MTTDALGVEISLLDAMGDFYGDPYGWVMFAFDWGVDELSGQAGPDEWQKEFLIEWGHEIRDRGFDGFTPTVPIRFATASGHGTGKAERLCQDAKRVIVSASNNQEAIGMEDIKWGDLKVGDYVFGKDGTPTRITGTRGCRKQFYKVTFDDGSSTDVAGEHEWAVKGRQERRKGIDKWRVMETQELLEAGVKRPNGKAMARQWEIPTCDPVQFAYNGMHYDAYRVGVWLGDGSSISGVIGSSRPEIWGRMKYHPNTETNLFLETGFASATLPGLYTALKDCGMAPVTCDTKFIADVYKYNSEAVRRDLVAGMLDTDGEVTKAGSIGYSSTSKHLVEDLIWMVRSLGGKAMMCPTPKKTFYVKDGVRSEPMKDCHRCTINFGGTWNPFTHTYKRKMLGDKVESRYTKRWIDSIEPIGMKYGMCIEVAAADHLYLANDFIVTHNSALSSWIALFIMSTRPRSKGVVTANTGEQLKTKTWSELAKWHRRCITGHWFEWTATSLAHKGLPAEWRVDAQTCREENSEAFAGLHAAESTPWFLFDEASAVPDVIYEVARGGQTDGEPMHFLFGNPTRKSGEFHDAFYRNSNRWVTRQIDSRTCKMTNKNLIQEWAEDYGEDSDFFKVRVRGQFPSASEMQYIPGDAIKEAMERGPGHYLGDDPLVCGVDLARGGDDDCMIVFRRGHDAKSDQTYRISGETSRDSMNVVAKITMLLDRHKPNVTFLDVGAMGGPIGDRLRQLGYHCVDVGFGWKADDEKKFADKASEMAFRFRTWILNGGALVDDEMLERELINRDYLFDKRTRLKIEPKDMVKKRIGKSPDWYDALALTFAYEVPKLEVQRGHLDAIPGNRDISEKDYNPLDAMDLLQ